MKGRVSRSHFRCIYIIQLNQPNYLVALDEISSVSGPETFRTLALTLDPMNYYVINFHPDLLGCELKLIAIYLRKYSYQNTE